MKKNEFRGPLLQSAGLLIGVIILATIAASAGSGSSGGGFFSIVAGIGNSILFVIGLIIGVGFSITLLVGIFLAAVAMVSPEQASQIYSDLKKNLSQDVLTCRNTFWSCCEKYGSETLINLEEQNRMQQEIIHLQANNSELNGQIKELQEEGILLKANIEDLQAENSSFKARIEEFLKQSPTSGILSYIDNDTYQTLFLENVEKALMQEMTYSQIDDYLSKVLPPELDKIIKDHPSLTRIFIRILRRN